MKTAQKKWDILFIGPGVIGSLYAARISDAGHHVSVLARGARARWLVENGIVLEHTYSGRRTFSKVNVVSALETDDAYDLIVVTVRKDQVDDVLPMLEANRKTPAVLFMVNNPSGYDEWAGAVGKERLMIGFPGAGGTLSNNVVRYLVVNRLIQATTLGEYSGLVTRRIKDVAAIFRQSGFPVAISANMDAWQKTHVAWVNPVAQAIYAAGCDNRLLSRRPDLLELMIRAIREDFNVLHALGYRVTPGRLKIFSILPVKIAAAVLGPVVATRFFNTVAVLHCIAARPELVRLDSEFSALAKRSPVATPSLELLRKEGERL